MAKLHKQKARKTYKCGKCGAEIKPGEEYFKIEQMYSQTKFRCIKCRPTRAELTSSEYLQWLYTLQDSFDTRNFSSADLKDDIYSEIEEQRDELQCRLDNMPEQLQDADSGQVLQDRISSLESAMDNLDSMEDFPDEDDFQVEDAGDLSEDELAEQQEDKQTEYQNAIDEWISELQSYIEEIE